MSLCVDDRKPSKIILEKTNKNNQEIPKRTFRGKFASLLTVFNSFSKKSKICGRKIPDPIEANVQALIPYLNIELFLMPGPKPKYSLITKISKVAVTKKKNATRMYEKERERSRKFRTAKPK